MSWVEIGGYKWPYRINEDGMVEKFYSGKWVRLNPYIHGNRAVIKMRTVDNRKVDVPLVWLVSDAFMGGRPKGFAIIHKNGAKLDCSVTNLKIVTIKECARLSCGNRRKAVEKIDRDGNVVDLYRSVTEAARKNHMVKNAVGQRCRNELKDPFALTGFSFRYERTR